jgi:hypothetical protein
MRCSSCSTDLTRQTVRFGEIFQCPNCAKPLRISERYSRLGAILSGLLAVGLAYYLGARGVSWLVWSLAGLFRLPQLGSVLRRARPPTLQEAFDDE